MRKGTVFIKFPKVGLGNMLLLWAKGFVFAHLNDLNYTTSSWWGIHWGALIRREKKNRLYRNYFLESSLKRKLVLYFNLLFTKPVRDPRIARVGNSLSSNYLFQRAITDNDLFSGLREHKSIIERELYAMLHPEVKDELKKCVAPVIGIHIRRGDFIIGNQTTDINFFTKGIDLVRNTFGHQLPVTVFTDADPSELAELSGLSGITFANNRKDITDILLLSKSNIMFLSRSSTFSYWAAFLSDALIVRPSDDWQSCIRHYEEGQKYNEVKWDPADTESTRAFILSIDAHRKRTEDK